MKVNRTRPVPMGSEQASSLTAHVVARTFQFSKSHEWRAPVAHQSTRPRWAGSGSFTDGRFSFLIRVPSFRGRLNHDAERGAISFGGAVTRSSDAG